MGQATALGASPVHPNGLMPMQGMRLAPRMLGMHSNVLVGLGYHIRGQCVQVQAARSNPLSSLMGSDTFPEPNTRQIIFLEPHAGPSIFYIDQISIILNRIQLKILQEENYTSAISLHKMIRFMCYKYIMNPLSQKFTISSFSTFLSYIFSESIFLKYHCIFSLYKVTDLSI